MQIPLSLFFHHVNVCHTVAAFGPSNTVIKLLSQCCFYCLNVYNYCAYALWVTAIIIIISTLGAHARRLQNLLTLGAHARGLQYLLTLGAHARGLQYLLTLGACAARVTVVVVCVCLSVCYSITHFTSGYSRPKRTHIFSGGWRSKNM